MHIATCDVVRPLKQFLFSDRQNYHAENFQAGNVELSPWIERVVFVTDYYRTRRGDLAFDDFLLKGGRCEDFLVAFTNTRRRLAA